MAGSEEQARDHQVTLQFSFGGEIGDLGNPRWEDSLGREHRMILLEEEYKVQRFW